MSQPTTDLSSPAAVAAIEVRAAELAQERTQASIDVALAAMVSRQAAMPQTVAASQVTPTSISTYHPGPDEVTVQFERFTLWGNTSYMRGQQAGFPSQQASRLVAGGHAKFIAADGPASAGAPLRARRIA